MKFKLIGGYPSSSDVFLAMERGEVDGICESLDSVHGKRPDWVEKTVTLLFQGGAQPNPEIKEVLCPAICQGRRHQKGDRISLRRSGHRPPLRGSARPAAGSAQNDARCLQRDHEGPGLHCRSEAAQARSGPGNRENLEALVKKIYAHPKPIVAKIGELIKQGPAGRGVRARIQRKTP